MEKITEKPPSDSLVRAIMVGDVVGAPGLEVLEALLPGLVRKYDADFVTVNGENAAAGFGLTAETLERILAAGADVVTSGNHVWEKRDFWPLLDTETRILRPANYPNGTVGRGWLSIEKPRGSGAVFSWVVINLQGRELMPATDCPFRKFDIIVNEEIPSAMEEKSRMPEDPARNPQAGSEPVILVDFHAESSREKEALGFYLDGRASLVAGTHTHVQTADERILARGTGYITDLGMTGVTNSIIGMDTSICLDRARTQVLYRMECAKVSDHQPAEIRGVIAEFDGVTGRAVSIERICAG